MVQFLLTKKPDIYIKDAAGRDALGLAQLFYDRFEDWCEPMLNIIQRWHCKIGFADRLKAFPKDTLFTYN
jgi:hypothetical protein